MGYLGSAAAIDANGNVYCSLNNGITQAVPVLTAGVLSGNPTVTAQSYSSSVTANLPAGGEFDGSNTFYITANSSFGRFFGFPISAVGSTPFTPTAPIAYDPCYPVSYAGGSAFGAGFYCSNNTAVFVSGGAQPSFALTAWSKGFQIDSAGSLWMIVGTNSAAINPSGVLQIIGPSSPTWPLLAYGRPGVQP